MGKQTPLHDRHIRQGAKMGLFAGYDMPLYYDEGVIAEHEWVRKSAGLFDVSHMGQIILSGAGATAFLEKLTPSSYGAMPVGRARYTVLTNEQGGIIDDLIVSRLDDDSYFLVVNAGCKDKDIDWIKQHLPLDVGMEILADHALIALQGCAAARVLQDVLHVDTSDMPYMWTFRTVMEDRADILVSRVGYTGEDGFEISVPADRAAALWDNLAAQDAVKPVGLAARDSLRLEMGYCLYGHDIDAHTTPVEAGLSWVIGKDNHSFFGAEPVRAQMRDGAPRHRVGVRLTGKGVAREGAAIIDPGTGAEIGCLTSGSFSPSLRESIGQGYVMQGHAQAGQSVLVAVRGRTIEAEIAAMPFWEARTKSMKRAAA